MIAAAEIAVAGTANGFGLAPLWRGVEEITLACDAGGSEPPEAFCAAALAEARRGAPVPVRAAGRPGGPGTLALRLSVAPDGGGGARVLTVSGERAVPIDDAQGSLLPRVARSGPGEPVAIAIARAFDAALPWRRAPGGRARALRAPFRQH